MRILLIASATALMAAGCASGSSGSGGSGSPAPVASVAITPAEVTMNRGDSMRLSATLRDGSGKPLQGKTVTWSSDDAAKVSVTAGGVVRALGAGSAKITAAAEGKSATAQVAVVEPASTVSRVTLDSVSELLEEGSSLQLEATAYDSADNVVTGRVVQWASSEPGTAGVAPDGLVTALRPGIVTVTATVEGSAASTTIRVFADYGFELLYGSAAVAAPEQVYSLDITDPAAVGVSIFGSSKIASHAAPSPDGTRIAFVVHGQWDGTFWQSMIFVADRDGGNAARLTYLPARNVEPAWSPDGSQIAFSSQPWGQAAEIWVMNTDGSNLVNLTADQPNASKRSPAWSPPLGDGSHRLAYALETGGSSFIWTMGRDGRDKREITDDASFFDSEPAWSPDGSTLVFQRTGDAIFADLYLVPSMGGGARALMPANPLAFGQFGPTWSPDGRLIAFTSKHADGDVYQVWTVWPDGTRLAQRTQDPQTHSDPAWITRL